MWRGIKGEGFHWAPGHRFDIGELEQRTAGEIFAALQQAGRGLIEARYLQDWQRRVFEAPHVVWQLAQKLLAQPELAISPPKYLNVHYLHAVTGRKWREIAR